jgi:hypothetical protein
MVTGPAAVVYEHFENLTDPQVNRGKNHALIEMIFVALTATICAGLGGRRAFHQEQTQVVSPVRRPGTWRA